MKNRLLLTTIVLFFIFDIGLLMYYVYASKKPPLAPSTQKIPINEFLPTVTLSQLKIDKEKASKKAEFQGAFTVKNEEPTSVSDISFLSEIFKINIEAGHGIELIDRQTLSDTISLSPKENRSISFTHTLPDHINTGSYLITLKALNQTGLTIASTSTLVKSVQGTNNFLEINWRDSKMIHEGQEKGILEGPTFPPNDRPTITLTVKNPQKFSIKAIPHLIIYPRANVAGIKPVADYTEEIIDFEPTSEKKLTFSLPGYEKAESYLAYLRFVDQNNQIVSGIAEFRWVIGGPGGKILTLKIVKTESFFGKTTLTGSVALVGPPDGLNLENTSITVKLFSGDDEKNLLSTFSQDLTISANPVRINFPLQFSSQLLRLPIIIVRGELVSKSDNTALDTFQTNIPIIVDYSVQQKTISQIIISVIVIGVIIVIFTILIKKKRYPSLNSPIYFFCFFILIGSLIIFLPKFHMSFAASQTTTPSVNCSGNGSGAGCGAHPQASFWSSAITDGSVGDTIMLGGEAYHTFCTNNPTGYTYSATPLNFLSKFWEDEYAGGFLMMFDAMNAGVGTINISQSVSTINNCWGNCSSSDTHSYTIRITKPFYRCVGQDMSSCDSPAGNFATEQECGSNCWESQEGCRGACDPGPGQPDPLKSPEEQHLECKDLLCQYVDTNINGLPESDKDLCQGASDCYPTATPAPPIGHGGDVGGSDQHYSTCIQLTDTHSYRAACVRKEGAGPSTCLESEEGGTSWSNWSQWSAPPGSCGPVQESRTCDCGGICDGPLNPGCWNLDIANPQYDVCGTPQFQPACYNKAPQQTPSNITVTQPLNSENPLYDGENVILSRDVRVTWKFNEGPAGCGNNASWGYNCTGNYDNKFIVEVKNPSGGIVFSGTKASVGGNGNKSYFITTTNRGITTDGIYTVKICPTNGAVQGTCANGQFTKVAIPTKQVSGNIYEHFNADPFCAVGINNVIDLELKPTFSVNYLNSSCTFTTAPGQQGIPLIKTNFDCAIKYDNINYDIPTKNGLTPDYLDQKFTLQMKNPPPSQFGLNDNYYCVTKSNNACQQNLPNNNFLCIDGTNPNSVIQYDFDQNDDPHISQGEPATLVSIIFDRINTGANASNYYKLKNTQYRRSPGASSDIYSPIPANPLAYDADDNGGFWFSTGRPGSPPTSPFDQPTSTLGSGSYYGNLNTGAAGFSFKNWKKSFQSSFKITPTAFLELIKSRKKYTAPTTPPANYNDSSTNIYIVNTASDLTISDNQINQNKIIIINFTQPSKTLTLMPNGTKFNTSSKSILIATNGTLKFDPSMDEANGVFFGQIVDLGDTTATPLPLKIKGNLISVNPINTNPLKRTRTDNQKPSLFVVFDAKPYMELLPYLSTTNYTWNELVP